MHQLIGLRPGQFNPPDRMTRLVMEPGGDHSRPRITAQREVLRLVSRDAGFRPACTDRQREKANHQEEQREPLHMRMKRLSGQLRKRNRAAA